MVNGHTTTITGTDDIPAGVQASFAEDGNSLTGEQYSVTVQFRNCTGLTPLKIKNVSKQEWLTYENGDLIKDEGYPAGGFVTGLMMVCLFLCVLSKEAKQAG